MCDFSFFVILFSPDVVLKLFLLWKLSAFVLKLEFISVIQTGVLGFGSPFFTYSSQESGSGTSKWSCSFVYG